MNVFKVVSVIRTCGRTEIMEFAGDGLGQFASRAQAVEHVRANLIHYRQGLLHHVGRRVVESARIAIERQRPA